MALAREKRLMPNDPFERLSARAQGRIRNVAALFEGHFEGAGVTASEGDRLALRRAMARFLIDSGLASANGDV